MRSLVLLLLYTIPFFSKSQSGYDVKFNGVSISDPGINHVALPNNYFLTKSNYMYMTNIGSTYDSLYLSTWSVGVLDTLRYKEAPYYVSAPRGLVFDLITMPNDSVVDSKGVYYVALDAKPVMCKVFAFWHHRGRWTAEPDMVPLYRAIPNNPEVTGYNLTTPVRITYERKF